MTANWSYALVLVGTQDQQTFLAEVYYNRENQPTGFIEVSASDAADEEAVYDDVTTAGPIRWFYDNGTFERRKSRSRRRGRRKNLGRPYWHWEPHAREEKLGERRRRAWEESFIERLRAQEPSERRRTTPADPKALSPKKFRAARLRAGLTYQSLADQVGVSRGAPYYWEHKRGKAHQQDWYLPVPMEAEIYARALVALGLVPPPHLPARNRGEK